MTKNQETTANCLHPDFSKLIKSLAGFIYYVTEEEDRFLLDLRDRYGAEGSPLNIQVFYPVLGLMPLTEVMAEWKSRAHTVRGNTYDIHEALKTIHQDNRPPSKNGGGAVSVYVVLDPDRWFKDQQVVRRVNNLAHQAMNSSHGNKIIVFCGSQVSVPRKLQRYMDVVYDRGLTDQAIQENLTRWAADNGAELTVTREITKAFRGLTGYESRSVFSQICALPTNRENLVDLDLRVVADYKRQQLNKTELVDYILPDTTFEHVGGVDRFKSWARKVKATWTDEGQAFGLKPPKGVLLVGAWGCGKSISVKALASEWGVPMIQLSMGRIRSSGVGETEANMRQVLALVESVAPCILWLDEAEKEMSGGASSAQSDAGTTSRVIGIFSTWMQETKAHVCLAMTANGVGSLPVELINRADERFFFDIPSVDERIEVLKIHLRLNRQDPSRFNLAELAEASDKMVGREIEQAINSALMDSFHAKHEGLSEDILREHLENKPRIYQTMVDEMNAILTWVGHDAERNEGTRARYASTRAPQPLKLAR
jgi:AAA+ superfamily predicted ATPase